MEKCRRRPDLDRPKLTLPCNNVELPQILGFEDEHGSPFTVTRLGAIAFGLMRASDIIIEETSSKKYLDGTYEKKKRRNRQLPKRPLHK